MIVMAAPMTAPIDSNVKIAPNKAPTIASVRMVTRQAHFAKMLGPCGLEEASVMPRSPARLRTGTARPVGATSELKLHGDRFASGLGFENFIS